MNNNNKIIHLKPPIIVSELANQIEIQPFQLIHDLMDMNVFAKETRPSHRRWRRLFARSTVILWSLPDIHELMSELQDKLDRGEITLDKYHASWIAQTAENERLHPGIHDRLYEY